MYENTDAIYTFIHIGLHAEEKRKNFILLANNLVISVQRMPSAAVVVVAPICHTNNIIHFHCIVMYL